MKFEAKIVCLLHIGYILFVCQLPIDPSKRRRDQFRWAVCLPASCTNFDISELLQSSLKSIGSHGGVSINVSLTEHACSTNIVKPWTSGQIVMGIFLAISICILIVTSGYDMLIYQKRIDKDKSANKIQALTLSFSMYTNMVKLFRPDPTDELSVMHGMRVYTMFLVMLGHRCLHNYGGPFFNPEFLEERYRKFQDMFLLNGTLITDTFFMLSGFLTCYSLIIELTKRRRLNLSTIFLYRWMRITPVYMVIVGFYATLLIRLGDGPIWYERVGREVTRCQQNWWTNLLYINNYVNVNQLCMFQSWYVTCDMHYFIGGTFIVIIGAKFKRYLYHMFGVLLFLSIAIPFTLTYLGRYDGVLRVYMSLLKDPSANDYYNYLYITSHNRAGPYVIGMISAYIYLYYKQKQVKFPNWVMWIGSISAIVLALGSQFGAWPFYIPGRDYNIVESALYAGLHRVVWAIAMAWIVVAGCTTTFGILHPILGLSGLTPLSRLTYSTFLSHGIIQLYTISSVRMPIYMSFPRLFWMVMGDIIAAFSLALFVHLLYEAPISGIQKMLLKSTKNVSTKNINVKKDIRAEVTNNNENVINMNQNGNEETMKSSHREQRF